MPQFGHTAPVMMFPLYSEMFLVVLQWGHSYGMSAPRVLPRSAKNPAAIIHFNLIPSLSEMQHAVRISVFIHGMHVRYAVGLRMPMTYEVTHLTGVYIPI